MANEVTSFEVQGNNYDLKPNLTFDTTPTIGSTNPVTSNGIALAVQAAAVGTDISVGRSDDTPIGYCSIAYGSNNTASADYGIVFGNGNTTTSEASIVSGYNNDSLGMGGKNAVFGSQNNVSGSYNLIAGLNNKSNVSIKDVTDEYHPVNSDNNLVFIGYVNPTAKKIYYDPSMTNEIPIPEMMDGYTHYFVDRTPDSGDRHAGDIYEYMLSSNTYTLTKILYTSYIELTNACYSDTYIYKGVCYFNLVTDKNYSDSSMTSEINPVIGNIYFDLNHGDFVCANERGQINSAPDWVYKKVYKGNSSGMYGGLSTGVYWGRKAYIETTFGASDIWHVYTDSEHSSLTDITSSIYDGEIINDISSGRNYKYNFNYDHVLSGVIDHSNHESSAQSIIGDENVAGCGIGSMILGSKNVDECKSEGCAIIGLSNTVEFRSTSYVTDSYPYFIVGYSNKLIRSGSGYGSFIIGRSNSIDAPGSNGDNIAFGRYNKSYGISNNATHLYGSTNEAICSYESYATGNNNKLAFSTNSVIFGNDNHVAYNMYSSFNIGDGSAIKICNYLQDGCIEIEGTIYDILINPGSSNTLPVNTVLLMYGKDEHNEYKMLNVGVTGSDGRSITLRSVVQPAESTCILGSYNSLHTSTTAFEPGRISQFSSSFNYMIGAYNNIYAASTSGIGLIGWHLQYYGGFGNPNKVKGAVILGAYNNDANSVSYTSGGKSQLIVGVGTDDSHRKNGFVVLASGQLLAPECPDTISAASSSSDIGQDTDTNKLVVTYGMLQDYAPRTPGAVGKPAVAIVTLSANDWYSDEQTVTVTDMSTSCVVIAQPNASPYAYNYHEIYVKEQGTDTLTFKCATVPSVDIPVKVVYWT